jgi:hypothetical protein
MGRLHLREYLLERWDAQPKLQRLCLRRRHVPTGDGRRNRHDRVQSQHRRDLVRHHRLRELQLLEQL